MRKLLLLSFVITTFAGAQTGGNWTHKIPQSFPSPRYGQAMAYDTAHAQVVLFGGFDGAPENDTWVWDGSNWTQKSPQSKPPGRVFHVMVYDAVHGQVVMFGGFGSTTFADTWVWDGSNWTQKSPQTSPSARFGAAMVYDAAHGQVVLFGGYREYISQSPSFNDTWVWDGSNWTQKMPQTNPPSRGAAAIGYDAAHNQIVLFGGNESAEDALPPMGDTWLWDGSNWSQKSPQNSPPARQGTAMAFDSAHGQLVLFGGDGSDGVLDDTWFWDGSNWSPQTPHDSPPPREYQAMAYDTPHSQILLFGGRIDASRIFLVNASTGDTWTWQGGQLTPSISAVVTASGFGGFSAVAPGSWVEIYGTNLSATTRSWAGTDFSGNTAPTSLDGVQVTIGGQKTFVQYVANSPAQINAQVPFNIATGGQLPVTVTNASGTSAQFNVQVNNTEPGLLAPAAFKIGGKQYVVGLLPDGVTYILPPGSIPGVTSRQAKPGETIVMYGVGFGPVTPPMDAGQIVTGANQLSTPLQILFGETPAQLSYWGLAPAFVGLYQFNVVVPAIADNDLVPVTINLGGVPSPQTVFTAVHQ